MSLYRAGLMHDNCTHLVKDGKTSLLQKHHIHEAELTLDPEIQVRRHDTCRQEQRLSRISVAHHRRARARTISAWGWCDQRTPPTSPVFASCSMLDYWTAATATLPCQLPAGHFGQTARHLVLISLWPMLSKGPRALSEAVHIPCSALSCCYATHAIWNACGVLHFPWLQARAPLCAQLNADRTLPVMLSLFMPQLQLDTQASRSWGRSRDRGSTRREVGVGVDTKASRGRGRHPGK